MGKTTKCLCVWFVVLMLVCPAFSVMAGNTQSTGYTVTLNTDGEKQISQDAYLPSRVFLDLGLEKAEDLYILNNKMYIADTGNKRCLVVDLATSDIKVIGAGMLKQPRGISADETGHIYVADDGNSQAYRFDKEGNLEQIFVRPTSPSFGKNAEFKPSKIIPADNEGIYLISEGTVAGMVHMDRNGVFLGYFGADDVRLSPFEHILQLVLNENQLQRYLHKTPPSFSSIFRGRDGLVYSINKGLNVSITKHNLGGANMLKSKYLPKVNDAKDICVTADGRMYLVELNGYITEITKDGYFLCSFAGPAKGEDRVGLFYIPSGIGADDDGNIYVLDQEKNFIQVFMPTPTQSQLHKAIDLYDIGDYDGSMEILKQAVNLNNTSAFLHTYMGKNYMQKGNYAMAARHFVIANAKEDYSQAFWEIRNIWLQNNLFIIFLCLLGLIVVYLVIAHLRKYMGEEKRPGVKALLEQIREKSRIANDIMNIKYAAFHPMDNAYEVKIGRMGSYASATLLYIIFLVLFILLKVGSGFIYSVKIHDFSTIMVFLYFAATVILFTAGNYFISSIKDGNGTVRLIYITGAYSLAPAIMILPFVMAFCNVSTYDELFIINTALLICGVWCVCNEVMALIEIHQYSFWQTIKNILMTLFFMVVAVIVLSLGYLLLKQIFNFLKEVYVEVRLRA